MSQLDNLTSISDLKERFAALKSLASQLTTPAEALSLCTELRNHFHHSKDSSNWRKACLKTSVFLINKHKLQFNEGFNSDTEHKFVNELEHCASSKEQFLLLKSHIKLVTKSQVEILQWIKGKQDDEVISKVFNKLKPLIDSLPETPIENTSPTSSQDEVDFEEPSIPETTDSNAIEPEDQDEGGAQPVQEPALPAISQNDAIIEDMPTAIEDSEPQESVETEEPQNLEDLPDTPNELPDIPDVPDLPEEEEFLDDDSDNLPAQFQTSNDPSDENENTESSFDPVHGRKKIIGGDFPKPESPGATWAALILLILPFALLFQAYKGAESQSFLSFLLNYFLGFLVIQSLIYIQKFLAGVKPDASWINCLIPTMPLYQKTSLGNPVCSQPLAIICSVMIVLALYAQPQVMALQKKNMATELAKAVKKPKQIKKLVTSAVVKSKKRTVAKRKTQKNRKRRRKLSKNSPPPLPEVNYADVQQEFMDRTDEIINAVYQYRLATLRKDSKAMSELGYMHDSAEGVKEDRVLAYTWYLLAVKHGDSDAQSDANSIKNQLNPEQLKKVDEYLKMELSKIPFTPTD